MMVPFLIARLQGPRFDDHSVPLDVLRDWAAFEELVSETARWLYLKENTGRKRVPRGFSEGFVLHLSGIEPGSAKPVIERVYPEGQLPLDRDCFDRARDAVLKVIAVAALGGSLAGLLPVSDLFGYFDHFGRSLRSGETLELSAPHEPAVVSRYDAVARKRLVLQSSEEYRASRDLRGAIPEADVKKMSFTLETVSGLHLQGVFRPEHRSQVVSALDQYGTSRVLVRAVVVLDRNDRPRKIEEATHIEILDPNDVGARLEELSQLRDGWLDGEGTAPPAEGIEWLADKWNAAYPADLPLPFLYPTPEGGVQAEWSLGLGTVSVEFDLVSRTAVFVSVEHATGMANETPLDMKGPDGWRELGECIERFREGTVAPDEA